jgi:trimeric autotransporter adhesin
MGTSLMRFSYGGHVTFPLRYGWLPKGLSRMRRDGAFHANTDVGDDLGLGSKMVESLGFWLKAVGLARDADFAGAVALGANATATRANQIVLGGAQSSVTVGNIAASTAAQAGPTDVMTVDATGTIGRDTTIRPAISALQVTQAIQGSAITALQMGFGNVNGRLTSLESGQMALFDLANVNRDRADRGIAAAVAISDAPFPSAPGKTSYTGNAAMYRGKAAFSVSAAHRMDTDNPFAVTAAISFAGKGNTAARVGVAGEF